MFSSVTSICLCHTTLMITIHQTPRLPFFCVTKSFCKYFCILFAGSEFIVIFATDKNKYLNIMATSINFTNFKNRYGSSASVVPYIKDGDAFYVQTKCTESAPFHVDRVIVTKSFIQLPDSVKNLPDKCVVIGMFMSDNPALDHRKFMAEANVRATNVEVTFTFMDDADHLDEDDETFIAAHDIHLYTSVHNAALSSADRAYSTAIDLSRMKLYNAGAASVDIEVYGKTDDNTDYSICCIHSWDMPVRYYVGADLSPVVGDKAVITDRSYWALTFVDTRESYDFMSDRESGVVDLGEAVMLAPGNADTVVLKRMSRFSTKEEVEKYVDLMIVQEKMIAAENRKLANGEYNISPSDLTQDDNTSDTIVNFTTDTAGKSKTDVIKEFMDFMDNIIDDSAKFCK